MIKRVTVNDAVIQQGIASDAAYAGRVFRDLADERYASYTPIIALCMAPYMSLFLHESYRKRASADPALAAALSSDVRSIVERSRHSLKLFEDTHRGIDGQISYFRDEIIPAHHSYFIDRVRFSPARRFAKNLGLYAYDKRLIMSTHAATFHMGIGAREQLDMQGSAMRSVYEQYGRCFHHFGARLDASDPTFISRLDVGLFNQRPDNVRAEHYYPSVFNGADTPYLNSVLTVFRGMINFANSIVTADPAAGTVEYTVFKIRYLTVYEIISSLKVLRDEPSSTLTTRSNSFIGNIVDTTEARLITARPAKPFRNALMHYNLDSRIDDTRVDINEPLFGLVPIYFPSYDLPDFLAVVDQCVSRTASAMEDWAAHD